MGESALLLALAERIVRPYTTLPGAVAAMVTGSVAKGCADCHSDLDLTVYYEGALPDDAALVEVRRALGGSERKWLIGERAEGSIAESWMLCGVEVQIGHTTVAAWEADIAKVLVELDCDTPLHKAMEGTLAARALFGRERIEAWQARLREYPPALARAMVTRHLAFFPLWALAHQFRTRDATIFYYQSLVDAAHHVVGVLAGLNRIYFTTFQFKRMRRLLDGLTVAPSNVAQRIEALFAQPLGETVRELRALVADTVALVERHMPDVDTKAVRALLARQPQQWEPDALREELSSRRTT